MRDNTPRTYVIATRTSTDLADLTCDLALFGVGRPDVEWWCGRGFYNHRTEPVAVIVGINDSIARELAKLHKQSSYLVIAENDRQAYDVDVATGYHKALGAVDVVSQSEAAELDAWTYVHNRFYAARGRNKGKDLPEGF